MKQSPTCGADKDHFTGVVPPAVIAVFVDETPRFLQIGYVPVHGAGMGMFFMLGSIVRGVGVTNQP